MATTLTDPLLGRLVDGRYEVVRRIARGGMATVYVARDRRLDRDVALKVMHPHLAEGASGAEFVARFRREARAAARLTHPGLVGVFDQGVDGDASYLTMELVEGTNLRRRIADEGSLTVREALRIAEDVLDALTVAHHVGLVHRDIKPENVLLGPGDRIKVADFGLARAVTEVTATTTGTILGTVAYLAPELMAHGRADTRTDVYAVGILLFEMLTGTQPFTGATPIQVAYQHVNSEVPAPSDRLPWLPVEVDELVGALAAREPDDRPADAKAALAIVRRTRDLLDDATLDRRADVAPRAAVEEAPATDVLDGASSAPVGSDDAPTPEGAAGADPDPHATERILLPGDEQQSRTIALPIGSGLRDPEPPRARRRWPWLVLATLLVAGVATGVWWYQSIGPGAWTTVPVGVVRVDLADATSLLTAHGIDVGRTSEAFDPTIAKGQVVSANPAEGEPVRKDGAVDLVVSKGPDLRTVPDGLAGQPLEVVVAKLTDAGFKVPDPKHAFNDTVAAGTVLSISADPGAQLPVGTEITVRVSDGPEPIKVPNVLGATQEEAQKALEAQGLKVTFGQDYSEQYPAGQVMAQSLAPDSDAHRTDPIAVTISQGPPLVTVPDVKRETFDAAKKQLEALGLVVERKNSWGGLIGQVVDQSVPANTQVQKGSTITLTVV